MFVWRFISGGSCETFFFVVYDYKFMLITFSVFLTKTLSSPKMSYVVTEMETNKTTIETKPMAIGFAKKVS
jgi:hypothetical protein